jgi:branched-chain amino acid transport system permease protein
VSAAYAGVAGALYAINVAYVSPDTYSVQLSLLLLVGAVVGGYGSIWGALAGALLIEFLPDVAGALPHVNTKEAGPATFFYGAVLVAIVLILRIVRKVSER